MRESDSHPLVALPSQSLNGGVQVKAQPPAVHDSVAFARSGQKDLRSAQLTDERLEKLQQSVDAVALEVERIGEAQRFREKLDAQRSEKPR